MIRSKANLTFRDPKSCSENTHLIKSIIYLIESQVRLIRSMVQIALFDLKSDLI